MYKGGRASGRVWGGGIAYRNEAKKCAVMRVGKRRGLLLWGNV